VSCTNWTTRCKNDKNLKPILFKFDPEFVHDRAITSLRALPYCKIAYKNLVEKNFVIDKRLQQNILGMEFLNPVGLGAGFDKNACKLLKL